MMADLERVHVKLGLSGTYWDKRPSFRISFNNTVLLESAISQDSNQVEYFEFDVEYTTDEAVLSVELLNKTIYDTVQSEDKSTILKDMLLNIVSVEIDEIDLSSIPYEKGRYVTQQLVEFNGAETNEIANCVNLGWNGTWSLTWANPFYLWLLENL
jgi:hypothetical protein